MDVGMCYLGITSASVRFVVSFAVPPLFRVGPKKRGYFTVLRIAKLRTCQTCFATKFGRLARPWTKLDLTVGYGHYQENRSRRSRYIWQSSSNRRVFLQRGEKSWKIRYVSPLTTNVTHWLLRCPYIEGLFNKNDCKWKLRIVDVLLLDGTAAESCMMKIPTI